MARQSHDPPFAAPLMASEPPRDCPHCPRLAELRAEHRAARPDWWNAPVPVWGDAEAWLAIVGLAPGRLGANRTGRAFTGDASGDLLFAMIERFDLAEGRYDGRADDGLRLKGVAIFNAVKCLPPGNRPTPAEIAACRPFLTDQLARLPKLRVVMALGRIAHESVLRQAGIKLADAPFAHGAVHDLGEGRVLADSYHCSRYNLNTGRLTESMFADVFERALAFRPDRPA